VAVAVLGPHCQRSVEEQHTLAAPLRDRKRTLDGGWLGWMHFLCRDTYTTVSGAAAAVYLPACLLLSQWPLTHDVQRAIASCTPAIVACIIIIIRNPAVCTLPGNAQKQSPLGAYLL
jgi:hypothetical protein